ncbi:MAG TPA: hydroxymethylbilane synthase [Candidatus Limnocylindria bacterium]|nr:hydroxymethylbilane synthase [Candidatus Limnocylindria bacterium]
MSDSKSFVLCTRGSALALAQANQVLGYCRTTFPQYSFEIQIFKTTGDKLQTASMSATDPALPKGLFTKELEVALLEKTGDIAVHSLKDLPTELPDGLVVGSVLPRADVRDVLVYRAVEAVKAEKNPLAEWRPGQRPVLGLKGGIRLDDLPKDAIVATSSTRRAAQVQLVRPDIRIVPIRGNVGTRLKKMREENAFDATLLAAAGLVRLNLDIGPKGDLRIDPRLPADVRAKTDAPPAGLLASLLEPQEMLPAVGQGAVALEVRQGDERVAEICAALNHYNTFQAVTAERSFLRAMGGGCQSPVAGYARVVGHRVHLSAAAFENGKARRAEWALPVREAEQLGREVAARLKAG